MATVYTYTETYNGSEILIEVERDVLSDIIGDNTVSLHQITAFIDDEEVISEYGTTDIHPPVYRAIADRLVELLVFLKRQIDSTDELHDILTGLGYNAGSEGILDYVVTSPTTGHVVHTWSADPDIALMQIRQATLSDYSDAVNIHSGALSSPIDDGDYTSGVTRYMGIRGQRTGEDWGPWSNRTIVVS